jgi:hypothetical protein
MAKRRRLTDAFLQMAATQLKAATPREHGVAAQTLAEQAGISVASLHRQIARYCPSTPSPTVNRHEAAH